MGRGGSSSVKTLGIGVALRIGQYSGYSLCYLRRLVLTQMGCASRTAVLVKVEYSFLLASHRIGIEL
jgi:hypothetical protein